MVEDFRTYEITPIGKREGQEKKVYEAASASRAISQYFKDIGEVGVMPVRLTSSKIKGFLKDGLGFKEIDDMCELKVECRSIDSPNCVGKYFLIWEGKTKDESKRFTE